MALIGVKRLRALLRFTDGGCELSRWSRRIRRRRRSQLYALCGNTCKEGRAVWREMLIFAGESGGRVS